MKRAAPWPALACMLLAGVSPACAHTVLHSVLRARAVVVTATYPDGTPLSFERYRVIPPGSTSPLVVGRTDRHGRVAFVPDRPGDWRVRVWTEDGHGLDLAVAVAATDTTGTAPASPPGGDRWCRIALGTVLLLLAGCLLRRRSPGGRPCVS